MAAPSLAAHVVVVGPPELQDEEPILVLQRAYFNRMPVGEKDIEVRHLLLKKGRRLVGEKGHLCGLCYRNPRYIHKQ